MLVVIAVILLICIFFLPFKVIIALNDRKIVFNFFLAGIPVGKYRQKEKDEDSKEVSTNDSGKRTEKNIINFSEKITKIRELFKTTVKLTKKYVIIENIIVVIKEGTGDAASTAISAGVLWSSVYSLISAIGTIASINKHDVQITPVYSDTVFSVNGKCIISSRVVYIIIIAITILKKIKAPKGKEE